MAGIPLDHHHTLVLLEFPVELIDGYVDRINLGRSVLQQAIGESARGAARHRGRFYPEA